MAQRRKPGKKFFVTVSLETFVGDERLDFYSYFEDNLVAYCISIERSSVSSNVSFHLHSYLEFSSNVYVNDLRDYISVFCDGLRIDVQPCRSKKSVLKYISKEDVNLLTNIKVSSLHFNYRLYNWAKNTEVYSLLDPFVVEHRNCYRFVKQYFDDFKFKDSNNFNMFRKRFICYMNWTVDVCMWWNRYCNDFVVKRPCLYLYGGSNVGKSSFVESLIGESLMKYVFYPGVGKFFMQGFRVGYHRLILFEEFDIKFYPIALLKRLLEGRMCAFPVKCESDRVFAFHGPVIFVSNFNEVTDDALKARLLFVFADVAYWESPSALVPKQEGSEGGAEIQEISDSEEGECTEAGVGSS